jgi:subtilase family serine protease
MMRAAAEGVGMYSASGDQAGVETPSTDPWVTAVGGTTLAIGKTGNRLFETGWSNGVWELTGKTWESLGAGSASGGGASALWAEPGYQRGVVPPALTVSPGDKTGASRTAPDISADADPLTAFAEGILTFSSNPVYSESPVGGTSLATPPVLRCYGPPIARDPSTSARTAMVGPVRARPATNRAPTSSPCPGRAYLSPGSSKAGNGTKSWL